MSVLVGIRYAKRLVRDKKIELVHARSQIPATIAVALKKKFGIKMIFDIRGLLAEEYVDANHWQEGTVAYRVTKTAEQRALAASDGHRNFDKQNLAHHQQLERSRWS